MTSHRSDPAVARSVTLYESLPDDDDLLGGRYRVRRNLGIGGMGEVVLAYDTALRRNVAIKRGRASNPGARAAVAREGRVLARLDHPGVVRVLDVIHDAGGVGLVLEVISGPSLAHSPARGGDGWLELAGALARTLDHIHGRGVIHADVKQENVLIGPGGVLKLVDFGIAWCDGERPPLDDAEALVGTPRAIAPELVRGEPIDPRADLFSLGVLLYEQAAGRSPFAAGDVFATLHRVLEHAPPPLGEIAPALPRHAAELVDHLLEKDPALRPQSAAEIVARLTR